MIPRSFCHSARVGLILGISVCSLEAGELPAQSPFVSGADAGVSAAVPPRLEWRGICSTAHGEIFSIYDTADQTSRWLALNEAAPTFVVRGHPMREGTEVLLVEIGGVQQVLPFKAGKVATLSMAAAVATPVTTSIDGVPNATPAAREFAQIIDKMSPDEKRRFSIFSHQVLGRIDHERQAGKTDASPGGERNGKSSEN